MSFTRTWLKTLGDTLGAGSIATPRGMKVAEALHRTTVADMTKPVLMAPSRKLNYRFMAAEAYWILSGDDTVAGISPYNKHIANFSDDGERFFGAYGPKVRDQLDYIVRTLIQDPWSRQAGMTLWRENPPRSKDIPCTIAAFFTLRDDKLSAHVFMRSSDIWLGLPYDVFNFSMLGHLVCARLNTEYVSRVVEPGLLYLTAANSHLYEKNWAEAEVCLKTETERESPLPRISTPEELWANPVNLMHRLSELRDTLPGHPLRWWEPVS